MPYAEASLKEEMQKLLQQLSEALEQVPPEKAEEAEAVAKLAETLVNTATEENPNKTLIQGFGDAFKNAAQKLPL